MSETRIERAAREAGKAACEALHGRGRLLLSFEGAMADVEPVIRAAMEALIREAEEYLGIQGNHQAASRLLEWAGLEDEGRCE